MTFNCFIIDDEEHAIRALGKYIERTPGLALIGSETNPLKAIEEITERAVKPDVIFLDIEMPQINGIDLGGMFPKSSQIIFATGHPEFAINAFEKEALDYLLKPITYKRFLKAVSKAREKLSAIISLNVDFGKDDHFFIQSKSKGDYIKIQFSDIIYIEAAMNYIKIHTGIDDKEGGLITYLTLKETMDMLPVEKFMQVHKSCIVNLQKMKEVRNKELIMVNGEKIAIGSSYNEKILNFIHSTLFKSKRRI